MSKADKLRTNEMGSGPISRAISRAYLARKEAEYLALKSEIETMRAELAAQEGQA